MRLLGIDVCRLFCLMNVLQCLICRMVLAFLTGKAETLWVLTVLRLEARLDILWNELLGVFC